MNRFSPIFTLFLGANIALSADFQVKPSSEFAWAKSAETNNDTSHPTKELLQRTGRDCQNPGYQNSLPQTDSGCLSVHEMIGDAHNSFMTKGPRKATNNTGTKSAASQVVSSPSIPNKVSPKAAIAASEPAKMGKMTFDEACALSPKEETAVKVMKDYLEALNCIDGYQPAICSGVLSAGLYFSLPLVRIKAIRSSSDSAKAREFEYLVRNRMELSRNIRLERSKMNEASKISVAKDAQEKSLLLKYQMEISESLEDAQYYREKARRTHIEFLNSSPYDKTIRPTGEEYDRLARQATQHAKDIQQNKYFPLKALLEKGSPRPHHIAEENGIKSLGESISGLRMQRSEIIERARLVSIPDNLKKTIEWTIKTVD